MIGIVVKLYQLQRDLNKNLERMDQLVILKSLAVPQQVIQHKTRIEYFQRLSMAYSHIKFAYSFLQSSIDSRTKAS